MRTRSTTSWLRAIAAAVLTVGPAAAVGSAPPPIAWQDPGPFAQPFLQLPFDAPEPVAPGAFDLAVRTLYANSIARERAGDLSVDVSLETAVPSLFLRYGLPRGFELQLSLPGAIDYAGFLGRPIKFVESLFGPSNPLRAGRPPAAAHFRIVRDGRGGVDWSGLGGSAGDPWIGVKRRVVAQDDGRPELAWRAALAIPTAPLPWGSGLFELGTGIVAGWAFGATSALAEADVMIPGGGPVSAARLQTRPHYALQLGVARRYTPWLTTLLQASAHTSALAGTGLDVADGTTCYLLAGVRLEPSRRTSFGFALVENVLHPDRGADITAVVELAWRP